MEEYKNAVFNPPSRAELEPRVRVKKFVIRIGLIAAEKHRCIIWVLRIQLSLGPSIVCKSLRVIEI